MMKKITSRSQGKRSLRNSSASHNTMHRTHSADSKHSRHSNIADLHLSKMILRMMALMTSRKSYSPNGDSNVLYSRDPHSRGQHSRLSGAGQHLSKTILTSSTNLRNSRDADSRHPHKDRHRGQHSNVSRSADSRSLSQMGLMILEILMTRMTIMKASN